MVAIMRDKEIHGILKANFDHIIKNVSGEEIKGTTKIYVDVPVVPRWLSDILTKFKSESDDYTQFKAKYDLASIIHEDENSGQWFWVRQHERDVDLAIALGVWVVEDEGE